ncbi:MAG: GtrA family protein [Bacteroidales bacterium]|nr:GtrA family protein [Bacteroidales bacterium]
MAGIITDTVVLWICSHLIFNGYAAENILSPFISFECANFVNFLVVSRFVFKDRIKGLGFRPLMKRFLAYNASYTATFFLKMVLLLQIQFITKLDVVWCNLIALAITGIINFILNDKVIFKNRKKQEQNVK